MNLRDRLRIKLEVQLQDCRSMANTRYPLVNYMHQCYGHLCAVKQLAEDCTLDDDLMLDAMSAVNEASFLIYGYRK